jgi:hypothetical protein
VARTLLRPVDMGRDRSTEMDRTVRRHVAVAEAFAEESPTSPAVHALVPLDAIPALAMPRAGLPWDDLGQLATKLLLRIDGTATTMSLVRVDEVAPKEDARELARLVARGLVRLVTPAAVEIPALELDLTAV